MAEKKLRKRDMESWERAQVKYTKWPVVVECGTHRYKRNRVIDYLLHEASAGRFCDLNRLFEMARQGCFSKLEMEQLYCAIGYSLCGFDEIFGGWIE